MRRRNLFTRARRWIRRLWQARQQPSSESKAWREPTNVRPAGRLNRFRRWATDALLVLLLAILVALLILELSRQVIVLEPFEVPTSLAQKGYTGRVVARKLIDRLHEIRSDILTAPPSRQSYVFPIQMYDFIPQEWEDASQIQMQGSTISLHMFARYLEELFGWERLRISGELTLDELITAPQEETGAIEDTGRQILRAAVRIGTSPARQHGRQFISSSFPTALDTLLCEAAQDVYREIQPVLLAHYLRNRGNLKEAEEAVEACFANSDPADDVLALVLWGDILLQQQRPKLALTKYRQAIELAPIHAGAQFSYGQAALQAGRLGEAEQALRQAERLAPTTPGVQVVWSFLHQKQGDDTAALNRLKRATELDPNHLQAWYYWARLLHTLHREEEAVSRLSRALEIHPTYPPALLLLKSLTDSPSDQARIDQLLIDEAHARGRRAKDEHRCPP